MKKFFVETNGYNMVFLVDGNGRALPIYEQAFDEPLTLEVAKNADYSNFDGIEDAEVAAANYTGETVVFGEIIDDCERVIEF